MSFSVINFKRFFPVPCKILKFGTWNPCEDSRRLHESNSLKWTINKTLKWGKTTKTKVSFCANTPYFYECTAPLTQAGQFNWRTSKEEQEHCVSLHFQWSGINLAVHVRLSDSKTQNLPQMMCTNECVADLWVVWPLLLCLETVATLFSDCLQWILCSVFLKL